MALANALPTVANAYKTNVQQEVLLDGGDASTALTSSVFDLGAKRFVSVQLTGTGTPNSVCTVQVSNDQQNWDSSGSTYTFAGAGTKILNLVDIASRYLRVVTTSGTAGNISVTVVAKS